MGVTPTPIAIDATVTPPDPRLGSPSSMAFFVGNPPQQMQIFTGTVNIDLGSYRAVEKANVRIALGWTTSFATTTSKVDLATIYNSDSEFLFAVDANSVEIDHPTGLITLVTDIGVQGTKSVFYRFAYHVQVLSDPVNTLVAGTIRWSESLATPTTQALFGTPIFAPIFSVTAGTFSTAPGGTPHLNPARTGTQRGIPVKADGFWHVAYQIDDVPLGTNFSIVPKLLGQLKNMPVGATLDSFAFTPQRSVQLGLSSPSALGVDFEMLIFEGPR